MPTGSEAFLELPIALGYGPATGPTLNTALCHIRTLVGRRINTARPRRSSWRAFSCVLWWGALDRLWLRAARFGRVCSTTGYITSGLGGPSPQALTLFGGVGFIARRLRRPEKGNADGVRGIFGTAYRVGLRPCDKTHLKTALCHIRTLVGRRINTAPPAKLIKEESRILCGRIHLNLRRWPHFSW